MSDDGIFLAQSLGSQTLVGVGKGERPSERGNCFGVFLKENVTVDDIVGGIHQYKIVNFNVENLNALIKLGLTWPIQCKALGPRTAIIHDSRIGERWYGKEYCEVCCPRSLLPITQRQVHEREIMRGHRKEHQNFIELNIGGKAEFP